MRCGCKSRQMVPFLWLVLVSIFSFSCGIESFDDYLENNPVVVTPGLSSVVFRPLEQGRAFEDNYFGVELFYRLYNSLEKANQDRTILEQRQSSEIIPGSTVNSFLLAPGGLNYQRPSDLELAIDFILKAGTDYQAESILILEWDSNDKTLVMLIQGSPERFRLGRSSLVDSSKEFSSTPVEGNIDYSIQSPQQGTDTVLVLQIFAASYGFNFTSFRPVYSKAVHLITLNLSS